MKTEAHPPIIKKELIPVLHFVDYDVLADDEERSNQRKKDLDKALVMGNADHNKVTIVFEDKMGTRQVETTIWGITESHVILKRNMCIPVNSIYRIEFP